MPPCISLFREDLSIEVFVKTRPSMSLAKEIRVLFSLVAMSVKIVNCVILIPEGFNFLF